MARPVLNILVIFATAFLFVSALVLPGRHSSGLSDVAKQKEKWIKLFDGKSFKGWHSYLEKSVLPQWKIEDGAIVLSEKGGGDLLTDRQYENFELQMEWKISEGGNSGILYHVHEDALHKSSDITGLEMQVLDNERHPNAKQGADRTAGSLFDLVPPSDSTACRPAGQWNKIRLIVHDGEVQHYLNDSRIAEYSIGGTEWDRLVARSKFKDWPHFGKFKTGHIALQDHGNKVWYRNIRIREL